MNAMDLGKAIETLRIPDLFQIESRSWPEHDFRFGFRLVADETGLTEEKQGILFRRMEEAALLIRENVPASWIVETRIYHDDRRGHCTTGY